MRNPACRRRRLSRTGRRHVAMAVLADHPDPSPGGLGRVEQGDAGVVQLADQAGHVAARRAEPLRVVVEVGQVDERQVGPLVRERRRRRTGRSSRCTASPAAGPQKVRNGKGPRSRFEPVGQPVGRAGDAEDLVAVGAVVGLGGDAEVDRRPLVEPPEELGRAERPAPFGAPVGARSRRAARPGSGAFDCCQNRTSPVSRKSQPLPTMPCPSGDRPVSRLAWAVHVTAGTTSRSGRTQPESGQRPQSGRHREQPAGQADRVDQDQGADFVQTTRSFVHPGGQFGYDSGR